MAEFASAADAPAARAVIYAMGFDHNMVQHALAQVGGNEHLATNLILNGEVRGAATASSSATAVSFSGRTNVLALLLRLLWAHPPRVVRRSRISRSPHWQTRVACSRRRRQAAVDHGALR
jgi:hypothetical protein